MSDHRGGRYYVYYPDDTEGGINLCDECVGARRRLGQECAPYEVAVGGECTAYAECDDCDVTMIAHEPDGS